MAKLLVPAGALCQANCGETFWPGQGQMAGLRGLQARCLSSPPKRTGMRVPSLIDVDVRVIQEAASAAGMVNSAAARAKAQVLILAMFIPAFVVGSDSKRGGNSLER